MIDLTLSDPDIPTPEVVKREVCKALLENETNYTTNAGIIRYMPKKVFCHDQRNFGFKHVSCGCMPHEMRNIIIPVPDYPALP